MKRCLIAVKGIVQGVGFRPFVYKHATDLNLKGWVNNTSEGVFIDAEGSSESLQTFLNTLESTPPPLSNIHSIKTESLPPAYYGSFEIRFSDNSRSKLTMISPDICTCDDCFKDISERDNPRYRYPFTNCTNCGPRFTIIKDLPYDRDQTTMKQFIMCSSCSNEYTDPLNRRFHAQPNACEDCGPQLWLEDNKGNRLSCPDPILKTQQLLKEGNIVAIKGIGGFHLACNGMDYEAISKLRLRKKRPYKPLAVMVDTLKFVKTGYHVSQMEESILRSKERPIVLLDKATCDIFPSNLSPNVNTCGVMLPYTPLHKLLFDEDIQALVMTSGNKSTLPLEFKNYGARENLSSIADFFLLHDRDIHAPVDDSIIRVMGREERLLRRARGYVPISLSKEITPDLLALGPNMKNTFCFSEEENIIMSQYNGDLSTYENFKQYKKNIEHFMKLYDFQPKTYICDLHPQYESTILADDLLEKPLRIQHHHAHILSCMAENNIEEEKVIGVAFDGTGYGDDGAIWGSEFLVCSSSEYERFSHFKYTKIFGGESAIKNPWKIALSYLILLEKSDSRTISSDLIKSLKSRVLHTANMDSSIESIFVTSLSKDINTFTTSSAGRLFDCVSALLEICTVSTYEGQASMELECCASSCDCDESYKKCLNSLSEGIDIYSLLDEICKDISYGVKKELISMKFHNTLSILILKVCILIRDTHGIESVCLSGGVFQNKILFEKTIRKLNDNDFNVYTHKIYPCNDGGISLGQIMYGHFNK